MYSPECKLVLLFRDRDFEPWSPIFFLLNVKSVERGRSLTIVCMGVTEGGALVFVLLLAD